MAQTGSATLLFDGSFSSTDRWVSVNGAFGKWKDYSCVPQPDSLVVVPASSLPGGRTGYAARFTIRPTSAYNCNGNQHTQLQSIEPLIPNVASDVWYGWSQMLDASWKPDVGTYAIGMAEGYQIPCPTCGGSGFKLGTSSSGKIEIGNNCAGQSTIYCTWQINPLYSFQPGIWEDWMYHIKWSTGNTGFVEIFKNGQLIWSKYNYPTKTTLYEHFIHRIGLYRSSTASTTQIVYYLNPKIGTTRADVQAGSSGTLQVPTQVPTPKQTSILPIVTYVIPTTIESRSLNYEIIFVVIGTIAIVILKYKK